MIVILYIVLLVIVLLYYLSTKKYYYWKKKGVPFIKPTPLFGNYKELLFLKKYGPQIAQEICQKFPDAPYVGSFFGTEPVLIVQDPEFVKQVLTKQFYYFSGRDLPNYSHRELLTQNLFFLYGDNWKVIRQNLTPLFSLTKMKNMFYLIEKSTINFEKLLKEETSATQIIEAIDLSARFTIDGVGSCIFGVNTETMHKNAQVNAFTVIGKKIMIASTFRAIKVMFRTMWPSLFYALGLKIFDPQIYCFLHKLLTGVFESRQYKQTSRHDFIDLILKWKEKDCLTGEPLSNLKTKENRTVSLKVNDNLLVAQCSMLFGAGYDTSANIMSLTLFEVAKHSNIQKKVLTEVDDYLKKHAGKIEYECVNDMPFLEACIDEALRIYPVAGLMPREVVHDYTFSTGLHLEKGTRVHIPIYHLHHNPKYHRNPEEFRPERFLGKEKENIVPYSYLPFGEGPRICLGVRFAKMQMLAGLLTVFKHYKIELAENMPRKLNFDPRGLITQVLGGIYLKFTPRDINSVPQES